MSTTRRSFLGFLLATPLAFLFPGKAEPPIAASEDTDESFDTFLQKQSLTERQRRRDEARATRSRIAGRARLEPEASKPYHFRYE